MRIPYLSRFLLALSLSAFASTAVGAVPQPLPTIRGIVVDPDGRAAARSRCLAGPPGCDGGHHR